MKIHYYVQILPTPPFLLKMQCWEAPRVFDNSQDVDPVCETWPSSWRGAKAAGGLLLWGYVDVSRESLGLGTTLRRVSSGGLTVVTSEIQGMWRLQAGASGNWVWVIASLEAPPVGCCSIAGCLHSAPLESRSRMPSLGSVLLCDMAFG